MDCDQDLVKKLRNEYPEQFMNLVKMHLSFCLDQSTDEVDCLTPQSKTHNHEGSKRSLVHKKARQLPKQPSPIEEGVKYGSQILQLIEYLSRPDSLVQEGIFRRSGKVKQQQELMTFIKEKNQEEISSLLESNQFTVHEVATVLKNLLADMPEPLLVESYYPLHCSLAKLKHCQRQIRGCQILILLLPSENAFILRQLLKMLHYVSQNEEKNKMNALNLGIVLAPHILCPRKMSAEDLNTHASSLAHIVSFMIENANELSDLPPEFSSDVQLYFSKRDPEEDSSSTSSTPPVKTTVTFVDREMTAKVVAEVGLDPTEAALAELYAYVQSQPESEVKKKWVHKFNKENGCGTPKVILNSSISDACAKNCKNLSQSIRKHLFNNGTGVTPRVTPKRRRSKSSSLTHALCYSGEASPPDAFPMDGTESPSRARSRRNLLESTPTSSGNYIRHPAFSKPTRSIPNGVTTPLASIPPDLIKENHQEQVISPLTQSAQRFPFYARDSIMTPRCRKPVFTFSPIDEPADDVVPHNSDALHLANMNLLQPQTASVAAAAAASSVVDPISDDPVVSPIVSPAKESPLVSTAESEPSLLEGEEEEEEEEEDDSSSTFSGVDPIQESQESSSTHELAHDLTSPFKSYLISREIQVLNESVLDEHGELVDQDDGDETDDDDDHQVEEEEDDGVTELSTSDASLLDSENHTISQSLLEFLDGNTQPSSSQQDTTAHSSPTTRPSPPLTKNDS